MEYTNKCLNQLCDHEAFYLNIRLYCNIEINNQKKHSNIQKRYVSFIDVDTIGKPNKTTNE